MKNRYIKYFLTSILLSGGGHAFAQLVVDNVFLQGEYLEIGISPNGSFGNSVMVPPAYHTRTGSYPSYTDPLTHTTATGNGLAMSYDSGHDGWTVGAPPFFGDYTMPGSPFEGWSIQAGPDTRNDAFYTNAGFTGSLSGTNTSYSNIGGVITGVWQGTYSPGGTTIAITQTTTVDTLGSAAIVTTKMVNTTLTSIPNLYYFRSCDPDNDETISGGSFSTNNTIVYQNDGDHRVMVKAVASAHPGAYLALATKDCRAKCMIYNSWPPSSTYSLATMYAESNSGYYYSGEHDGDIAIGLVYNLGTLAPGDSTVISYAYVFNGDSGINDAFPDPQMVVNMVAHDSVDSENACTFLGDTLPVHIIHGNTRNWTLAKWTWSPSTALTSTTGVDNDVIISELPGPITYTITGTDSTLGNCNTKTFLLTVYPPPASFTVSNNGPLCEGSTLSLTINDTTTIGTSTYAWTGPAGFSSTLEDPFRPGVTVADSGIYTVSVTHNGCTSAPLYDTVVINATPAAPITTNVTYCQYFPTDPLTATGTGLMWYTVSLGGTGSASAPVPSSLIPGVTTYYVSQTSAAGCTSLRAPLTVTINPKPEPPYISDDPGYYCPGATFVPFTATGGGILWYTSATGGFGSTTSPTLGTTVPGTDTIYASQTLLGCESDRSFGTYIVYDSVRPVADDVVKLGCGEDTVIFINYTTTGISYRWDFGDLTTSTLASPTHLYSTQGTYVATLYVNTLHCEDSVKLNLNLVHPIAAAFTYDVNAICQGAPTVFTNTSTATGGTYIWSFGDGDTSSAVSPTHTYTNPGAYNVYVALTDFVPCHDTAYGTVNIDTSSTLLPLTVTATDTTICAGTYVTFGGQYTSSGLQGMSWSFSDGSDSVQNTNPISHAFPLPGNFTVTENVYYRACPDISATRNVTVVAQPSINLGPDTSICQGSGEIVLMDAVNAGNEDAMWRWSNGGTGSSITVSGPGYYSATVTIGGCSATDTVVVLNNCYIDLPRGFSPNGDGTNDYFNPRDFMSKGLNSFRMDIYNRWGQLVFSTSSTDGRGWDGRFNDTPQPEGTYIYIIDANFVDGRKEHRQGNITLLR